ncbi:MAG: 23S rRNA (uracil(1939)-C(5))-methyltransferase RlmD [Erysipelotrichaceae bacterium]|nr:23S rRNA (uracil(1939)-C(5))-methyltransferase RlmD [Erysipelotrichaceae bacterium]
MKTEIKKMGINGEGIGYYKKKPVFIPGAVVGDEVTFSIRETLPKYYNGQLVHVDSRSEYRCEPVCKNKKCDGCALKEYTYDAQIKLKRDNFVQALQKYADISPDVIADVVKSDHPYHYRNQCKLPLMERNGKITTGMYQTGSNYAVECPNCVAHEQPLEDMRIMITGILNKYHLPVYTHTSKEGLRYLILRHLQGQFQLTLVGTTHDYPKEMIDDLMAARGMKGICSSVNTRRNPVDLWGESVRTLAGNPTITMQFDSFRMDVSPRSFYQLNSLQAVKLYEGIRKQVPDCKTILELYSGVGGISFALKEQAEQIIGVEVIQSAVDNANHNAKMNHCKHIRFICSDVKNEITHLTKKYSPETIVVDPPRSGLDDEVVEGLLKSKANRIVYVSCNVSTLGKNLCDLKKNYQVERIIPYDMFPNTPWVESITVLVRKKTRRNQL